MATSTEIALGAVATDFRLPATDGRTYALKGRRRRTGAVIVFICNHCPYVKAVIDRLVADARMLMERGRRLRRHLLERRRELSGRFLRQDAQFAKRHVSRFPIFTMKPNQSPAPMAPSARRISSAMTGTSSSNIAAASTKAARRPLLPARAGSSSKPCAPLPPRARAGEPGPIDRLLDQVEARARVRRR